MSDVTAARTEDNPSGKSPPARPKPGRLRSAVFWSYALTAGRVGTTTVVTFLLAKLLGPTEFGLLTMAVLILGLAQTLLQQGLVSALVQRAELDNDHLDSAFVVVLLGSLGIGALMAAVSPLWALANQEPRLTAVTLALTPLVPVHALTVVPEAVLRRALSFQAIAVRTFVAAVASGLVGIGLALAGAGVWALVAQQLVAGVAGAIVLWAVCPWRPRRRPRMSAIRELWRFSAHSANAGLALMLGSKADQFVTSLLFGPVTMGVYRLATRLPEMFVDVTVRSLQQVALPALSRLQDDRRAFAARLADLQHVGAVSGLPLLGLLAGLAGPLVAFLGPQWADTELPLRVLCLYGAVNVYGVLLGPALQAIGHPGRLAAIAWLRGVLGVVAFVAVGLAATGRGTGFQATSIAVAAVGLQIMLTVVAIRVTRRTIGTAKLSILAPTLPAAVAGVATFAIPFTLDRLSLFDAPLTQLLGYGSLAGLGGAILLWLSDYRLRRMVRSRLWRR